MLQAIFMLDVFSQAPDMAIKPFLYKKGKKVLNHLGKIGLGMLVFMVAVSPAGTATPTTTPSPPRNPSEATKQASGLFQESKKAVSAVLNPTRKFFASKAGLVFSVVTTIAFGFLKECLEV